MAGGRVSVSALLPGARSLRRCRTRFFFQTSPPAPPNQSPLSFFRCFIVHPKFLQTQAFEPLKTS